MEQTLPETSTPVASPALPPVTDLLMDTFADLRDNLVEYLLAALGMLLVMIPAMLVLYGLMALGVVPGLLAQDEVMLVLGVYAGIFVALPVFALILLFPSVSLSRAAWHHVAEEEPLGISSPFSRLFEDVGSVLLLKLLLGVLTVVGLMMCYLPALLVAIATVFALPALIAHRLSPVAALKLSLEHTQRNLTWHLGFWGLGFVVTLVAGYIPIVGGLLGMVFYQVYVMKGYKAVFGAGPEPVIAA
ncbi:MAG: hypothetical protein JXX28_11180 [Deltaproteobacteria bacterium]|nr:hypothetical protein [Deltaproteobacteria bacterium]